VNSDISFEALRKRLDEQPLTLSDLEPSTVKQITDGVNTKFTLRWTNDATCVPR
jgi:hypothetical protein